MAEHNDKPSKAPVIRTNEPRLSRVVEREGEEAPWLKRNANLLILIAGGVISLGLLLILGSQLGWWFTGPARGKPARTVATRPSGARRTAPAQPAPGQKQVAPAQTPSAPQSQTGFSVVTTPTQPSPSVKKEEKKAKEEPKEEKPKEPPLSDDVAKWKQNEDYLRARKENHSKLLEAIAYLGEKHVGSEPTAGGLTDMLRPLTKEKPASGSPSPPSQDQLTKLVEAIVKALGRNGTRPARETLEQVLAGKFATDDDKAAVEAAVKTLVAHPSKENEALLFQVLSDTEKFRPAKRAGPWTAKDLHAKAIEWVESDASAELRTQLAQWLVGNVRSLDTQDPMCKFLMKSDPRNLGAQIFFYKRADTPNEVKLAVEDCLLDDGKKALSHYLGIPEDVSGKKDSAAGGNVIIVGGAGQGKKADSKEKKEEKTPEANPAPQIVAQLWSPEFRKLLMPQLTSTVLERQVQLLSLSATIPDEAFRANLNKIIKKRWSEGPAMLKHAKLTEQVIDPGLLVAIKLGGYRRESDTVTRLPAAGTSRSGNQNRSGPAAPRSDEIVKKQKAEQEWMTYSAELVDWLRKQFAAAADAKSGSDPEAKLPEGLKLSDGAKVKAAHHIVWPDDAPPELAKLDLGPMEVYYVRAEESNRVKKLTGVYHRKLSLRISDVRLFNKMIWMDSMQMKTRKGWRRSVDLLITRTTGGVDSPMANNDEADFIIEILVIETKDPTKD